MSNSEIRVNLAAFPWSLRKSKARSAAKETGAALYFRQDGAGVLFFVEDGRIRQKTWKRVLPVRTHNDKRDYAAEIA